MSQIADPRAIDYRVGATAPQDDIPLWLRAVNWWNDTVNKKPDPALMEAAQRDWQQQTEARQRELQQYVANLQQTYSPETLAKVPGQVADYIKGVGQTYTDMPIWLRNIQGPLSPAGISAGMKVMGDVGHGIEEAFAQTPYFGAANVKPAEMPLEEWEKKTTLAQTNIPNPFNPKENIRIGGEAAGFLTPDIFMGAPMPMGAASKLSKLGRVDAMWQAGRQAAKTPAAERFLKFQEWINDATYGLRKMAGDVEKSAYIAPGGEKDLRTLLTRTGGVANAGATRYILAVDEIKKIAPDVVPNDINTIIYATHAKEVLAEKGAGRVMAGGFKDPAELDQVIGELQAKLGPDAYARAQQAAEVVQRIYQTELQRLVGAGLINSDLGKVLAQKYPWYNPLQYVDDAEKVIIQGKRATPYDVISSGLKRLTEEGTAKGARAPLDVLADQLVKNEVRIHNNDVAKSIVNVAMDDPKLGVKKVPSPSLAEDTTNMLSFFENGERQTYQVPDFIYREATVLTKMSQHPIPSLIGAINGVSRAAFTSASPAFVVSNMLNDSLTAFIRGGIMPHQTGARLIESLKGLTNDKIMQAFRLSGAYQQRFYGKDLAQQVIKSGGQTIKSGESFLKKIWRFIPEAGEAGEQAPRMAYFQKQLDKTLPGWRKMTAEQIASTNQARSAAAGAVELTINFGRGGYLVKSANPVILFLNANMEGMKMPFRALREVPAAKWRLAGVGVGQIGLTGYNLSYPEYFDIPDHIRWGSVVVMLPPKEKDTRTGKWKPNYATVVPRTREWGTFLGSTTYAMEKMFSDNPTDFGRFSAVMAPMLLPFAEIPMPAVLSELTEQVANYDFYRSQPIVPTEMQGLPPEQQVQPWVSPTIAAIANGIGVSPLRAQHFFSGIFGGAGAAATSVTDYIAELIAPQADQRIVDLAEQYKGLSTQADRNRFMMELSQTDKDAMLAQMRKPEKGVPIISSVGRRIFPEQSGQLYKTGQELAQKETGISPQQTKEVSGVLGKVSDLYLQKQRAIDTSFKSKKISGVQWKEARAELGQRYQGALDALGVQFPTAAQVQQDPATATQYYQMISTLAGTIPDSRDRAEVLAAGWYAIDLQESVPGSKDWNTFFQMRDQYKASLTPEDRALLSDYLQSKMTDVEKLYARAQELMAPYWGIEDYLWSKQDPKLKEIADYIRSLEDAGDDAKAKALLQRFPQILNIRRQVAQVRKNMKAQNPAVAGAYNLFYGR